MSGWNKASGGMVFMASAINTAPNERLRFCGLDALVFTGGVGENAAAVREQACAAFEFLGLKLDPQQNAASERDRDIATADSTVRVVIVHAEEDWAIAKHCWQLAQSL